MLLFGKKTPFRFHLPVNQSTVRVTALLDFMNIEINLSNTGVNGNFFHDVVESMCIDL